MSFDEINILNSSSNLLKVEVAKGLGEESRINLKKPKSSINHSILCGLHDHTTSRKPRVSKNHSILCGLHVSYNLKKAHTVN